MGETFPAVALLQEASRNSALVETNSCARVSKRSGSASMITDFLSITSISISSLGTKTGIKLSIPSAAIPAAIFSNISDNSGCALTMLAAFAATASVIKSSRQAVAKIRSTAIPRERWSAIEKVRISSTVSPQNSTRNGCSNAGGNRSTIPPRTANWPRRSTKSTRSNPNRESSKTSRSSGKSSPVAMFNAGTSPRPATIG